MDGVGSATLLGFALGLQHATDPDHLVAVATIVTRERRFTAGALTGALKGVGHMLRLLTTLGSAPSAVLYLLVFGLGTIGGMRVFTAALACPVGVALRFTRVGRVLAFGTSLVSIAFGLVYGWQAI